MKKAMAILLILSTLLLAGCRKSSIGIIGGADGPTAIFVAEAK